jgi:peptidoglycan/LPS O-acetylase OafA/YrhL
VTIALCVTAIVVIALLSDITWPYIDRRLDARRERREAEMIPAFEDIPATTDRVIFFPRAAGGAV